MTSHLKYNYLPCPQLKKTRFSPCRYKSNSHSVGYPEKKKTKFTEAPKLFKCNHWRWFILFCFNYCRHLPRAVVNNKNKTSCIFNLDYFAYLFLHLFIMLLISFFIMSLLFSDESTPFFKRTIRSSVVVLLIRIDHL